MSLNISLNLVCEQAEEFLDYVHTNREPLEASLPKFSMVSVSAFYNGRERSACFKVSPGLDYPNLFIVVGESRNSDALFLDHWTSKRNTASMDDFTDQVYEHRQHFAFEDYPKAYGALIRVILEFVKAFEISK